MVCIGVILDIFAAILSASSSIGKSDPFPKMKDQTFITLCIDMDVIKDQTVLFLGIRKEVFHMNFFGRDSYGIGIIYMTLGSLNLALAATWTKKVNERKDTDQTSEEK